MNDNLQSELVFSYLCTFFLQWLKSQPWFPWVTSEEKNLNKVFSGILAFIGSAGIVLSAQHAGAGHWVVDISGLTMQNVAHVLGHAIRLYGEQKLWFKTVAGTPAMPIPPAAGNK